MCHRDHPKSARRNDSRCSGRRDPDRCCAAGHRRPSHARADGSTRGLHPRPMLEPLSRLCRHPVRRPAGVRDGDWGSRRIGAYTVVVLVDDLSVNPLLSIALAASWRSCWRFRSGLAHVPAPRRVSRGWIVGHRRSAEARRRQQRPARRRGRPLHSRIQRLFARHPARPAVLGRGRDCRRINSRDHRTYLVLRSTRGLALQAIRDDELAARSLGVSTLRTKFTAFVVAAFFTGSAGAVLFAADLRVQPGRAARCPRRRWSPPWPARACKDAPAAAAGA